jgi:hypothetical protein
VEHGFGRYCIDKLTPAWNYGDRDDEIRVPAVHPPNIIDKATHDRKKSMNIERIRMDRNNNRYVRVRGTICPPTLSIRIKND